MPTDSNPSSSLDLKHLDLIIEKMVENVSDSKTQVFEIGEQSRAEHDELERELHEVKQKVKETIDRCDKLDAEARLARGRLADISQAFDRYGEEDIRRAYERANNILIELSIVQEMEKQLKSRRDELERRILQLKKTVEKADKLVGQISVVLNYLKGDLQQMGEIVADAREKQAFGLKVVEAQEEERKRLSREIHDGPAQTLAQVLLGTDVIERVQKNEGPEAAVKELKKYKIMLRDALSEVRRIIYDLRPMTLDDLGLVPTLQKYLNRIVDQYKGINIDFRSFGAEKRLPSRMEAALFRLAQEAVQNACKHAKPSLIKVMVEFHDNKFVLLYIKDDGIGFDKNIKKVDSYGLIGMKERVELLGGTIEIHSKKNQGTAVLIKIPID